LVGIGHHCKKGWIGSGKRAFHAWAMEGDK
jgi:hypothetical protein